MRSREVKQIVARMAASSVSDSPRWTPHRLLISQELPVDGNVEMEEGEMHRLVRHGSKETGHTARAATRITAEQGTWSAGAQKVHAMGRKPPASFRGTGNDAYDAQAMEAPMSGKCHAGRSSPEKKRTSNGA